MECTMMSATIAPRSVRLARPRISFRSLIEALVQADARHRRGLHLRQLDDRMLRDMGISRADVDREIRRPTL
jgi:uncharacterized protein YjiS (DUF1127 family)